MASQCLFYMKLDNEELEIDAPFIFEKNEELKKYLLEQQVRGDSTEGRF